VATVGVSVTERKKNRNIFGRKSDLQIDSISAKKQGIRFFRERQKNLPEKEGERKKNMFGSGASLQSISISVCELARVASRRRRREKEREHRRNIGRSTMPIRRQENGGMRRKLHAYHERG